MKKIIKNLLTTILLMVMGSIITLLIQGILLVQYGYINLEERSVNHNKETYVDGVLIEQVNWSETTGATLSINVNEGVNFGN